VVLLVLILPLLVNAIGMWQEAYPAHLAQALKNGYYTLFPDSEYRVYPWGNIGKAALGILPAGLLAWLMAWLSNTAFYQGRSQRFRLELAIVGSLLIAAYLAQTSVYISDVWSDEFYGPGPLFGLPGSAFVRNASWIFVFPLTAALIFYSVYLFHLCRRKHSGASD